MEIRSDLVVISWWSNCLGLASLHALAEHAPGREIYVVQVGKPEESKARFRAHLPPGIRELPYPPDGSGEDWRVREAVARVLLRDRAGLWFIDHDLIVQEDCTAWLDDMDRRLGQSDVCLCHPAPLRGPSITNPAFWLSPVRFPPDLPSFARVPYREDPVASRPYALRQSAGLMMPGKDTLVVAMEFLRERGMTCGFPLSVQDQTPDGPPPFPRFEHLGGLYTFTGEVRAEQPLPLRDWMVRCVERFSAFYAACPPAWIRDEDPVLLQRIEEFRQALL